MPLPSLSIVIPSYNGRPHLERCLPSLRQHSPRNAQVLVVDDASTDDTATWIRTKHPWVEVLTLPFNQGFCRAVNAGIAQARGDVVELLNNDTEVCPDWAESALPHFADPSVGSVAPLVLNMDQRDVIDSAGQQYHICGWGQNRGYGQTLTDEYLVGCEVFGASGSSGFYRRAALNQAGGLLPEFRAYCEDIDLSFRLRWAGYRSVYEPASRVLHKGSASYGRQPARVLQLIARNEEFVYWINVPLAQLLASLVPHLGFLTVRAVRQAWQGQFNSFIAGKYEALSSWRWVLHRRKELRSLVEKARQPLYLNLATGPRVLQQGWQWMTRRKIA